MLRPADASKACQDLGIDIGGRRLRSALDVDPLMRDWEIAQAAGFLLVEGTRARGADSDPERILEAWAAAATFLFDLADDEPCPACLIALHELHTAPEPMTVEQLLGAVVAIVKLTESDAAPCSGCGEIHTWECDYGDYEVAEHVAETVTQMLAFDAADLAAGRIWLTPLGGFLAGRILGAYAIPPEAGVSAVVAVIGATALEFGRVLIQPWVGARSVPAAVNELLAFAESATGVERVSALAIAGVLGIEAAEAYREWADRPGFGAYARLWLAEHDEPVPEDPADEPWLVADTVDSLLETLTASVSPDELRDTVIDQIGDDLAEAADLVLGSGHPKAGYVATWLIDHREPEPDPTVFQLKITLLQVTDPRVWRRVLVPASTTLWSLHGIIQRVMGWEFGHLYMFTHGRQDYGPPGGSLEFADDSRVRLSRLIVGSKDKFRYTYDFGDDWEHEIVVEKTLVAGPGETYPSCTGGEGACPPEDCGGVWGYADLKEALADPAHEEHENLLEWLGLESANDFDPAEFSPAEVNTRLRGSGRISLEAD